MKILFVVLLVTCSFYLRAQVIGGGPCCPEPVGGPKNDKKTNQALALFTKIEVDKLVKLEKEIKKALKDQTKTAECKKHKFKRIKNLVDVHFILSNPLETEKECAESSDEVKTCELMTPQIKTKLKQLTVSGYLPSHLYYNYGLKTKAEQDLLINNLKKLVDEPVK